MHSTGHTMICVESRLVVLLVVLEPVRICVGTGAALLCGKNVFIEGQFEARVMLIQQEVLDRKGG